MESGLENLGTRLIPQLVDLVGAWEPVLGGGPPQYSFISPGGFHFWAPVLLVGLFFCQDLGHSRLGISHLKSGVFLGPRTVPQEALMAVTRLPEMSFTLPIVKQIIRELEFFHFC